MISIISSALLHRGIVPLEWMTQLQLAVVVENLSLCVVVFEMAAPLHSIRGKQDQ